MKNGKRDFLIIAECQSHSNSVKMYVPAMQYQILTKLSSNCLYLWYNFSSENLLLILRAFYELLCILHKRSVVYFAPAVVCSNFCRLHVKVPIILYRCVPKNKIARMYVSRRHIKMNQYMGKKNDVTCLNICVIFSS